MRFSMEYQGGSIALAFCVYQSPMPCSARVVSFHAKVYYKALQAPSSPVWLSLCVQFQHSVYRPVHAVIPEISIVNFMLCVFKYIIDQHGFAIQAPL